MLYPHDSSSDRLLCREKKNIPSSRLHHVRRCAAAVVVPTREGEGGWSRRGQPKGRGGGGCGGRHGDGPLRRLGGVGGGADQLPPPVLHARCRRRRPHARAPARLSVLQVPELPPLHHGGVQIQPESIVHARLNRGVWELRVKWKTDATADADETWITREDFQQEFPDYQLEDKLFQNLGGNVTDSFVGIQFQRRNKCQVDLGSSNIEGSV